MPVSTAKPDQSIAAAFKDRVSASIACSLLREGGVSAERGQNVRFGECGVSATGLFPEQFKRAMVILRRAGATEIGSVDAADFPAGKTARCDMAETSP